MPFLQISIIFNDNICLGMSFFIIEIIFYANINLIIVLPKINFIFNVNIIFRMPLIKRDASNLILNA